MSNFILDCIDILYLQSEASGSSDVEAVAMKLLLQ